MNTLFSNITVLRIHDICKIDLKNTPDGHSTNRPHSALYFKRQGRTVYSDAYGSYVSDKDHVIFLPTGCSYSLHFDKPGVCDKVEFDCDYRSDRIVSVAVKSENALLNTFDRLENLWLFKKPSYFPKSMSVLYELLSRLDSMVNTAYASSEQYRLIEPGLQYLETHYDDPALRMKPIAAAAGITEAHFRRIFRSIYQTSPMDYVRNIRINRAKSLLSGEFTSVYEIALSVGFTDKCTFSKAFHRTVGMSPIEYARKHEE